MKLFHWVHTGNWGGLELFVTHFSEALSNKNVSSSVFYTKENSNVSAIGFWKLVGKVLCERPDVLCHYTGQTLHVVPFLKFFCPQTRHIRIFMHSFGNKKDFYHHFLYRFFDRVIFPTRLKLELSKQRLPISENKKYFQYFGVKIPPREKKSLQKKKVISSLSRVEEAKGVLQVLHVFQDMFHRTPALLESFVLNIYGVPNPREKNGQEYFKACEKISRKFPENIFLKGFTREPLHVLKKSDFLIFASKNEFYGFALLEAYSQGVPVLTTPQGSFRELNSEKTGFFMDLSDPEACDALFMKLSQLTDEEYQILSENCFLEAKRKFDIEQTTQLFIDNIL